MSLKKWWFSFFLVSLSISLSLSSFPRLPQELQIFWKAPFLPTFEGPTGMISSKLFSVLFPSFTLLLFILLLVIPLFNREAFKRIETAYPVIVNSVEQTFA